jgi:ketosteroid isomerase-like protein
MARGANLRPMETENVARCREAFELWNADADIDRVLELYSPDIELIFSPTDAGVFTEPVLRGRDAVRGFLMDFVEQWDRWRWDVEEYLDAGEHVVVLLRGVGTGRASPVDVPTPPFAYVCTYRDGLVVRMQDFADQDEALRSVGLPPRGA